MHFCFRFFASCAHLIQQRLLRHVLSKDCFCCNYAITAWQSWVPNIVLAEVYIRYGQRELVRVEGGAKAGGLRRGRRDVCGIVHMQLNMQSGQLRISSAQASDVTSLREGGFRVPPHPRPDHARPGAPRDPPPRLRPPLVIGALIRVPLLDV